ncbi:MAG: hypothetical protein ACI8UD_001510, partial [Planctomycetota bacterium]
MPHSHCRAFTRFLLSFCLATAAMAQATTPGFAERFALAADRTALLNELTP